MKKLWVIFTAALLLRVLFFALYVSSHPARALGTIPFLFEPGNIANALATGHGFANPFRVETGPTAWMPPVYPLFLAAIFRIFGPYTFASYLAAAGANVLFSALTCVPIFLAGRRMFDERTGATAAWLWAVFPNAILLPYESLFEGSLAALLAACLVLATFELADSKSLVRSVGYGVLWGVALLTNATLLGVAPFLAWHARRARLIPAAIALVLCLTPWTLRNYAVFHRVVPLRSVAGLALWLGNNDDAGSLTPGRSHPITNQAERERYVVEGEMPYMDRKRDEAVSWMLENPRKVISLASTRFVAIWTGGSANPVADAMHARSLRFWIVTLFNLFVACAAVYGLLQRGTNQWIIGAFMVVFPLAYYLTLAPPRYRHPADPAILLSAAFAIRTGLRK